MIKTLCGYYKLNSNPWSIGCSSSYFLPGLLQPPMNVTQHSSFFEVRNSKCLERPLPISALGHPIHPLWPPQIMATHCMFSPLQPTPLSTNSNNDGTNTCQPFLRWRSTTTATSRGTQKSPASSWTKQIPLQSPNLPSLPGKISCSSGGLSSRCCTTYYYLSSYISPEHHYFPPTSHFNLPPFISHSMKPAHPNSPWLSSTTSKKMRSSQWLT